MFRTEGSGHTRRCLQSYGPARSFHTGVLHRCQKCDLFHDSKNIQTIQKSLMESIQRRGPAGHHSQMIPQYEVIKQNKQTLPKALRTQALTALTSNFGLVGLVW